MKLLHKAPILHYSCQQVVHQSHPSLGKNTVYEIISEESVELTKQVFASIPQAHRTAFLTGAECILHAVSLMMDKEAYK